MTSYRGLLRLQTAAALERMAREQNCAGSTPDGEMDILVARLNAARAVNVLQLGTYLGWSALIIADQIAGRGGNLLTVDPEKCYLDICLHYAELAGLNNVTPLLGCSQDPAVVAYTAGVDWDAIYIDTTHHYTQTVTELDLYAGRVTKPGTLVLMHDASEFARTLDLEGRGGVKAAITEWLAAHDDWDGMIYEPPDYPDARYGLGALVKR